MARKIDMSKERYIGVMSGTSMDGVDTVLVEFDNGLPRELCYNDFPFPLHLKQALLRSCTGQPTDLMQVGTLDRQLGHLYADAVQALMEKANVSPSDITAIGNHGQTVFHQPTGADPFTMQLGDANIIAIRTGITTVADFRRKDMALGGQGAPLVPAFHQQVFSAHDSSVVILNIGGIANISVLRPNMPTLGYDTGPGNMLMDAWVAKHQGKPYDKDGQWALSGCVNHTLLTRLMSDTYLEASAPKSTGREHYNLDWLHQQLTGLVIQPADVQRTLCEFSANTISNEVEKYTQGDHPRLIVCGGGANNPLLMDRLAMRLPDWKVDTTDDHGMSGDNMEAIAFAWLAQRRLHNLPSNLPEVTGASRAASLGVVYSAN